MMDMSSEDNSESKLYKTVFSPGGNESKETQSYVGPSKAIEDDVRFAENFTASGGKFIYCESNGVIIASKANLTKNLELGLEKFKGQYLDKLPSLIELREERKICKANHARLLNAAGTANVFVFYVDTPEIG